MLSTMEEIAGPPAKKLKMTPEPYTPDPSSPSNSEDAFPDDKTICIVQETSTAPTAASASKPKVEVVINTPATQERQSQQNTPISPAMSAVSPGDIITVSTDLSATSAPPKIRKPRLPKERTTQHLNLSKLEFNQKLRKKQLASLLKIFRTKKKIVVIAGAGISVAAGIPDFRSSTGLFTTLRSDYKLKGSGKHLFDAAVYKDDQSTSSFHDMVRKLHGLSQKAEPTAFHELLQTLAREKRLLRLYTQNVDCIDTQLEGLETQQKLTSKAPWPTSIQLHGGVNHMVCQKCGDIKELQPHLFEGSTPPDCRECLDLEEVRKVGGRRSLGIGKLRPRMVLYNEDNPDADAIGAVTEADLRARPDALIVVGTSLKIPGVKRIVREMCGVVRDLRGGMTVWLNRDDPPMGREFDGVFDLVIKGDCQHAARLIRQGDTPLTPSSLSDTDSELSVLSMASDEEMEEMIRSSLPKPEVVIPRQQLLSPSSSPHPKKAVLNVPSKGVKRLSDGTAKKAATTKKAPQAMKVTAADKKAKATVPVAKASTTKSTVKKTVNSKAVVVGPKAAKLKAVGAKATASRLPVAKTSVSKSKPTKLRLSKPKLEQKLKITGQFKTTKTAPLEPTKAEKKQQPSEDTNDVASKDNSIIHIVKDVKPSIEDAENKPQVDNIPPPPSRSPSPPPPPPTPHTPTDLAKMSLANILI